MVEKSLIKTSGRLLFKKANQPFGIPLLRQPETTAVSVGWQIFATAIFPPSSSIIWECVFILSERLAFASFLVKSKRQFYKYKKWTKML